MARGGLYKSDVQKARDALRAQGKQRVGRDSCKTQQKQA